MRSLKKGLMQTTDANTGFVMAIVLFAIIMGVVVYVVNDNQLSVAATHAVKVSEAAEKYISDNSDLISSQSSPTTPFNFTADTLVSQGYLPANFTPTNNFSQAYRVMVLEPQDRKFHTLIVTTGGKTLTLGQAVKIGAKIGATGGYVQSGIAKGTQGGWSDSLSQYAFNPGDGHVAVAQFFSYGVASNDFLYRKQVAGHPELNTMSTDLSMGGNSINSAGNVAASGTVSGTNLSASSNVSTVNMSASGTITSNVVNSNVVSANTIVGNNVTANNQLSAGTTVTSGETYTGGWFRTRGDSGWYSEKWGGGIYQSDPDWVRVYNGKSFFTSGELHGGTLTTDGRATIGEFIQINGVAAENTGCSPNGLVGRDGSGAILSCTDGAWKKSGGGKPGYYCRYTSMSKGKSDDYVGYTPRTDRKCGVISPGMAPQGECSCMKIMLDY